MHGHNIYTVDEYFPPEVIDFLSDLEIYVNSLTTVTPPPSDDVGDIILDMVDIPLLGELEESSEEGVEVEL